MQRGAARSFRSARSISVVAWFLLLFAIYSLRESPMAQPFSPYSEFEEMLPGELGGLQIKLTYVGVQSAPIPTVVFTAEGSPVDISKFAPFRRPDVFYANDEIAVRTAEASTGELAAVISTLAHLPEVTDGGVAPIPYISFSMYNNVSGMDLGFEAVISQSTAVDVYAGIRDALSESAEAIKLLDEQACFTGSHSPGVPEDVTSQASIELTGVRLSRSVDRYVGQVTIRNQSGQAFDAPLSLVVDLSGSVRLGSSTGRTCATQPVGREFIDLPGPLSPGESVTLDLEFFNPHDELIELSTKLLAGPGAR